MRQARCVPENTFRSRTPQRAARAAASLLLAAGLGAPSFAPASAADPVRIQTSPQPANTTPSGSHTQAQRLSALQGLEDESLAPHKAGEWSDTEVVMVILLLVFLFPIGLIVLIVLLCTDGG